MALKATEFWLDDQVEYELKTKVGEGRFATVWKAQEDITDRILAVKVFKKSNLPELEVHLRCAEKFEEQLVLAAQGGVSIMNSNSHEETPFSAMPRVVPLQETFLKGHVLTLLSASYYNSRQHASFEGRPAKCGTSHGLL